MSEMAGYALLVDALDGDTEGWLAFLRDRLRPTDLSSDEAFGAWIEREVAHDPELVARVRRVVRAFRADVLAGVFPWLGESFGTKRGT